KSVSDLIARNAMNWAGIPAASNEWADKVFPELPQNSRKEKLWDTLFTICRIKEKDPISAWQQHIKKLDVTKNFLNRKQFTTLKLTAPGTDLIIGLPKKHVWEGVLATSKNGIEFAPNIPTEEIFTMPHKDKTEGIVRSTKPLYYGGVLIEDFSLKFSEGRIIEAKAKKGEEFLLKTIETDDGAHYLGEIALVPHSSPISQTGLLFYNILIDENAASHIALGRAYQSSVQGGDKMSDKEFSVAGGNHSKIHLDFMIGSGEMNVDGITEDHLTEPIMRKGEWAYTI
ncbi:MAG: aminopeptidase, partial [Promethearchaeota archaeon]